MANRQQYITLDNGKSYILDIDAIVKFVTKTENNKTGESEITEIYQKDITDTLDLKTKQIREIKSNGVLQQSDNVKYDIVRTWLEVLYTMGVEIKGMDGGEKTTDIDKMSIGESVVFNTLLYNGFLKEI